MLDAHYKGKIDIADYWSIGDIRSASISPTEAKSTGRIEAQPAQDIELVIIGFGHDTLDTKIGDMSRAAITVQTLKCLSETGIMYLYDDGANKIWNLCTRRTWCNNDLYNALSDIKKLIKPVVKLGNSYGNIQTQGSSVDKIFFLSDYEIFGKSDIASSYTGLGEDGTQYEYMQTESNRIKYIESSKTKWWTRTVRVIRNDIEYAVYIGIDGSNASDYPAPECGIAPAFCL